MKRCPICDKTFDDSMKFCQTDGTPLVDASQTGSDDLMKTMVSSPTDLPEPPYDSFKTIVGNPLSAGEENLSQAPNASDVEKTQILSKEEMEREMGADELGENTEKDFSPPSPFGNSTPSWMDSPGKNPNDYSSPSFGEIGSSDYGASSTPFQEPEQSYGSRDSFNQAPFGGQAESYNPPIQQSEWTPPPAPVSGWQNQSIGQNTAFQTPISGQGEDKTLAIVSLVCGILSLTCCGPVTGIAALITGYMAKNNVESNPQQYGGRGLALAGIIMGGISLVVTVLYFIFAMIGGIFN